MNTPTTQPPRVALPGAFRRGVVAFLLTAAFLAGGAAAQTTRGAVGHQVAVTVPGSVGIRIVGTAPARVMFDYGADLPGYLAAANAGVALEPTAVVGFDDIEIRVPGGRGAPAWYVDVSATPFAYVGTGAGAGLDLPDLWVARGASSGLVPAFSNPLLGVVAASWSLGATPQRIAEGNVGSGRWRSLGFNGVDYRLDVDGDEDSGRWRSSVTYTVVSP